MGKYNITIKEGRKTVFVVNMLLDIVTSKSNHTKIKFNTHADTCEFIDDLFEYCDSKGYSAEDKISGTFVVIEVIS